MDQEKAYQILDNVLKQIALKREEHEMLRQALNLLYNMSKESIDKDLPTLPNIESV